MGTFLRSVRRFILKQRIEQLRSDVFLALERQRNARLAIEGSDAWIHDAHKRIRKLRANLSLLERPDVLLKEAIRSTRLERSWRDTSGDGA